MYKLAYEKCVCFLFLVILAVLSCSGFRIDNLAMTDISKKNFQTSTTSVVEKLSLMDRPPQSHKIRHQRLRRAQLVGHNVADYRRTPPPPPPSRTLFPAGELFHHRPPLPRSQRSSPNRNNRKKRKQKQTEDISVKAYKAEIVVRATTMALNTSNGNQWVFKRSRVYKDVKNLSMDPFVLEIDLKWKRFDQDYLLFLNASSTKYWPVAQPKLIRKFSRFNEASIIRVCQPNFVPTPPKIVELTSEIHRNQSDKRILRCKVKGFPIPKIVWKRNGEQLRQNHDFRIQYKRKESRLTIKQVDAGSVGEYECLAEGVDGRIASKNVTIATKNATITKFFSAKECDDNKKNFCYNGGTCQVESTMGELYCICPPYFSGTQCEKKDPTNTSMYPQPAIYTCKVGLSTKIYC